MSLRANSLREHIRDLAVRPDGADADEQGCRGTVGHEVLQALQEIDRIALATTDATGAVTSLSAPPFTPFYGATDMCGMTALNTARLIGSATSVRLTGRQTPRA